jgi:hypothetical protein
MGLGFLDSGCEQSSDDARAKSRVGWKGGSRCGIIFDPDSKASEAIAAEEGFIVVAAESRRINTAAIMEDQAGHFISRFTEADEFHGSLVSSWVWNGVS